MNFIGLAEWFYESLAGARVRPCDKHESYRCSDGREKALQ
jgi:hypothetical protein